MTDIITQLQQDVEQELQHEPSIDASEICVAAFDGKVSLTGTVKSYAEKYAAAQVAERVDGVTVISDETTVTLPDSCVRDDEDIAKVAVNTLQWDVLVPSDFINVSVHNGWLLLEGDVDYWYQRTEAERAVRNLTGVKGLSNLINVKKPVAIPSEIKARIDYALRHACETDAEGIKVNVVDDKVVLRGKVSSRIERHEAERATWSTSGVSKVENDIVITA